MRVLYKAFPVAFRQVAFRQATLRERNRSEHVPTSSGCPVPYFMGGYDGFRVVEHDLLELKDAASLYVAGEPEAQRLVLLCAGFPCDHSLLLHPTRRAAGQRVRLPRRRELPHAGVQSFRATPSPNPDPKPEP